MIEGVTEPKATPRCRRGAGHGGRAGAAGGRPVTYGPTSPARPAPNKWLRIAPFLAVVLVALVVLWCAVGYLVWGVVQHVQRDPWVVTSRYLSAIDLHHPDDVARETCDRDGQPVELARSVWSELEKVPANMGGNEGTYAHMRSLPDDPVPDGEDRVRVPVAVELVITNVPTSRGDADFQQDYRWTAVLEHRWGWCVLRVERDRPFK